MSATEPGDGDAPVSTSRVDLCSVAHGPEGVVIHFGQRGEAGTLPAAWSALLQQRVTMSEGGAARLQDLLVALLQVPDGNDRPPR
jgi:hypothetical protein